MEVVLEVFISISDRPCLTAFPITEKRFENTTSSRVFLMSSEVFGIST